MAKPWIIVLIGLAVLAATVAVVGLRRRSPAGARGAAVGPSTESMVAPGFEPTVATDEALDDGTGESELQALPDVLVDPAVLVEKRRRRLTVFSAGEAVKRYRIALGGDPVGDKELDGDSRTPEGEFYVCTRNAESKYHRSMGLSYPNAEDADRGLETRAISKREHRAIVDALRHMTQPPWKTRLGGEIMIHGGGTHADWTDGCIALSDNEAEELFAALPLGTPVDIVP